MAYSLLRDVNSGSQDWRVRVRVARLWDHLDGKKNNELIRIQFVMVGEKGSAMQGCIGKNSVERFNGRLVEGHAYYLRYFDVKQVRDAFRAVDHAFEVWLTKWTQIDEIVPVPQSLPRYAYTLRSFQSILGNVNDRTYLADIVGIVTGVSPIVTIVVKGRPTSKRTLRLTDTRDTAMVALWGSNAEAIDSEQLVDVSSREPVVALVMGCTHKKLDSLLEFSASYGSQVCVNAAIPEVVELRDRLAGSVYPVELLMERGRQFQPNDIQVVTVLELVDMNPHATMVKRFRCKITIDGLQPNRKWWYLACDACNSKAYEDGSVYRCGVYRCGSDKCANRSVGPRLCLPVVASGDGASVEMVFFGDLARDLVGKAAYILVAQNCGFVSTVPKEITSLTGRSYVVDVSVSRYTYRVDEITFQVVKFYPEGSSVFVALCGSPVAGESDLNPTQTAPPSAGNLVLQNIGAGSGDVGGQNAFAATSAVGDAHTPPPTAPDTPNENLSAEANQNKAFVVDASEESIETVADRRECTAKRSLFADNVTDVPGKSAKKNLRKGK